MNEQTETRTEQHLRNAVQISLSCQPDPQDPETSGHDLDARRNIRNLKARTVWGWCQVEVRGTLHVHGHTLTVSEYLGGCSYAGPEDFWTNSDAYDEMVETVQDRLISRACEMAPVGG